MRLQLAGIFLAFLASAGIRANGQSEELIPRGARIYVSPMPNGFDSFVVAGLREKKVPLIVVTDRGEAAYEIQGSAESDKADWRKMLFLRTDSTTEKANIQILNLATGRAVFAYSVVKRNATRGEQSTAEAVAKHIKDKVNALSISNLRSEAVTPQSVAATSKVYISHMPEEFSNSLKMAIQAKKLPFVVVDIRNEADFEITGQAKTDIPSRSQKILLGDRIPKEEVSVLMTNLKTDEVVFAYSRIQRSFNGHKGGANAVANHLRAEMNGAT